MSPGPNQNAARLPADWESYALGAILLLAFLHGLLYLFLVPPWQHYDEPAHFEYVWLAAHRPGWPQPGDSDPAMRRALAVSMTESGFFQPFGVTLDPDNLPPRFVGLEYLQLDEPPLYYFLASLPVRLLPEGEVALSLYAARQVSLVLFVIVVLSGWGVAAELLPAGLGSPAGWLRLLLPLALALLPGLADTLTAVNNDAAAAAFFALFLWGGVRLLRRRNLWNGLWVLAAAAACVFTKSTVYVAAPLAALALILAAAPGRWRPAVWGAAALGLAVFLAVSLWNRDAAYWYRMTSQAAPTRLEIPAAPAGRAVLQVETSAPATPAWLGPLHQPLSIATGLGLRGQTVTLGAWMWASAPVNASLPAAWVDAAQFSQPATLSTAPTFYAFTFRVPEDAIRVWISLAPGRSNQPATVYYDGLTLAAGQFPLTGEAPSFEDGSASAGTWGGQPFTNLIRNASAERTWPSFRPEWDNRFARLLPDDSRLSPVIFALLDPEGAWWAFGLAHQNLGRTFWAKFGWGTINLLGHKPYRPLGWITYLGLAAGLAAGFRWRREISRREAGAPGGWWSAPAWLGAALLAVWAPVFIRGIIYLFVPRLFLPPARYAFPAVIPSMLWLAAGWWWLFSGAADRLRLPRWAAGAVFLLGWLALDVFSLYSLGQFFR